MKSFSVFLFIVLQSCASQPGAPSEPKKVEFPDWVIAGSGAFAKPRKVFRFVASGPDRPTAEARARKELQDDIYVYTFSFLKFKFGCRKCDVLAVEERRRVEGLLVSVFKASLEHIEIIDEWVHPDRTVYVLSQLDLEHILQPIRSSTLIKLDTRAKILPYAEKDFADLVQEQRG